MQSYDRLFPNQDTIPRGGFVNLIALPLQHEPRQLGNSVFIDDQFEPFPDQWAFLVSVPRVDPSLATKIAQEAIRTDQVVGVRFIELTDDQEDSKPWTTPPSRRNREIPITGPLPSTVTAVLSQRLYIEKQGLPSGVVPRSNEERAEFLNDYAWFLVGHRPGDRDKIGVAEAAATEAVRLTGERNSSYIDTLAAVKFATGDHSAAIALESKAVDVAKRQNKDTAELSETLHRYESEGKEVVKGGDRRSADTHRPTL